MNPYIISVYRKEDIPSFKPEFLIKTIEKIGTIKKHNRI